MSALLDRPSQSACLSAGGFRGLRLTDLEGVTSGDPNVVLLSERNWRVSP